MQETINVRIHYLEYRSRNHPNELRDLNCPVSISNGKSPTILDLKKTIGFWTFFRYTEKMRRVLSEENLAGSQEIINLNEFGMGVHGNNYKLHDGFQVVVQGDNGGYHFIRRISTQNRQNKGYRNGPYIHPRHQRVVRVDSFKSAL